MGVLLGKGCVFVCVQPQPKPGLLPEPVSGPVQTCKGTRANQEAPRGKDPRATQVCLKHQLWPPLPTCRIESVDAGSELVSSQHALQVIGARHRWPRRIAVG